MPTYTYRCQSCGVQFDKIQKFSDKPLTRCPECRTGTVRRIPQPSAIIFKGSGWYSTDHRSPSGQSSMRKADGESKKAEGETKKAEGETKKAESTSSTSASTAEKGSKPAKKD